MCAYSIYADLIELDLSSDSSRISPQVLQKVFECWELFKGLKGCGETFTKDASVYSMVFSLTLKLVCS